MKRLNPIIRLTKNKTFTDSSANEEVKEEPIENKEEINQLRHGRIKDMLAPEPVTASEQQNETIIKLNMQSKGLRYFGGTLFKPVEYSEFKPNKDWHTCQYCGLKSKSSMETTYHINAQHEMTTWYKCSDCTDVFMHVRPYAKTHETCS